MNERFSEKMFGIIIFTYDGWDDIETEVFQFYNIEFPFESMKKFNGFTATKNFEGNLKIYDNNNNVVFDKFVIEIPEFKKEVSARYIS